jgi:protein AroM
MGKRRVGAVTIGQAPRVDVTPELLPELGAGVELVEAGALDALSAAEIAGLAPGPGDTVLVSRLRDGSQARLSRSGLVPLIQQAISSLESQVDVLLMLCTGTFPAFRATCPVLYPEHLLFHVVQGILGADRVAGILTPDPGQVAEQRERWAAALGRPPEVEPCSPYLPEGLEERLGWAARALRDRGAQLIVLDCLGYSRRMKQVVARESGLPVVLARTVLARVAGELLDDGEDVQL